MTATDYMNWRALLKGNYRKGVRAMEQIANSSDLLEAFLGSAEALSVVFSFDPADPDPNALDLYAVAVDCDLGAAALGAMLGKGGPATAEDVSSAMDEIMASREMTNALFSSYALSTFVMGSEEHVSILASSANGRAIIENTELTDGVIRATAANRQMLDAIRGGLLEFGANMESLALAVSSRYLDSLEDELWDGLPRVSYFAARFPAAFSDYIGKSLPVSVEGHDGCSAVICAVGADKTKDGESGFTLFLSPLVERAKWSTYSSASSWHSLGSPYQATIDVFNKIDPEMRSVCKTVSHKTMDRHNYVNETTDVCWLASVTEVGLAGSANGEVPESPYDMFSSSTRRVLADADGNSDYWWLRSKESDTSAYMVSNTGYRSSTSPTASDRYIVPFFCI